MEIRSLQGVTSQRHSFLLTTTMSFPVYIFSFFFNSTARKLVFFITLCFCLIFSEDSVAPDYFRIRKINLRKCTYIIYLSVPGISVASIYFTRPNKVACQFILRRLFHSAPSKTWRYIWIKRFHSYKTSFSKWNVHLVLSTCRYVDLF